MTLRLRVSVCASLCVGALFTLGGVRYSLWARGRGRCVIHSGGGALFTLGGGERGMGDTPGPPTHTRTQGE